MLRKIGTPFIVVLVYILFLLALSGEGILRATYSIAGQVRATDVSYRLVDDALETIRLDIYKIAVATRDGLLNQRPDDAHAAVIEYERDIERQIHFLRQDSIADNVANIQKIEDDVHAYLRNIYLVADQAYSVNSRRRLDDALGRRHAIVNISAALSRGNDLYFVGQQQAIGRSVDNLRVEIVTILALIAVLGTAASGAALYWISGIEKSNQRAHGKTIEAQERLKSLSRQLVSAQEIERKTLSRELHDEIGQSLTALKLELANGEKIARAEGSSVTVHLQRIREIADQTLRAAKNISLGLRPPMLDDLGLVSALNWFTAEFSRRTGITVELTADGAISRLSEGHRTCVFRVVQEALTNCARHSQAKSVTVKLDTNEEVLTLIVADDGAGFRTDNKARTGLGLLSMQERAAELGGTFEIASLPGNGTRIHIVIPTARTIAI